MKYRYILVSLGLCAALLSGCGSSSDGGDTIVGTWHKDCYLPDGSDYYRIQDYIFRDNNTGHATRTYYDDEDCTLNPYLREWDFDYNIGVKMLGDDGEETAELDFSGGTGDSAWEYYTMFRFLDNGNLLTAGTSEENDASTPDKRANHFDENWIGYTRK